MNKKLLIGMVHLLALPGTPKYDNFEKVIEKAKKEARLFEELGFDAIIIENMHDVPYLNREVGEEIIAAFTAISILLKQTVKIPIGIQILAGANIAAIAVAKTANLDFIRAEGFVFSHVADEGFMNSDAGKLLRYRKMIDAENIKIYTDIKKKHSAHSITADISIAETAKAAEFFLSDGVIITGSSTGLPANIQELKAVRENSDLPIFIGSGITPINLKDYYNYADGFIVGSYIKKDGYWENEISIERCHKLIKKIGTLAKQREALGR